MKAQRVIAEGKSKQQQQQQQNLNYYQMGLWYWGILQFWKREWNVESSVTKGKINWWQEEKNDNTALYSRESQNLHLDLQIQLRILYHHDSLMQATIMKWLDWKMEAGWWWCTPLIPALRRQGRHLCEFEASLVYKASYRTASKATQRNPVSKNQKEKWKNWFMLEYENRPSDFSGPSEIDYIIVSLFC